MARKHASSKEHIKHLGLRVPPQLWTRIKHAAVKFQISAQAFCIEAIERHLARAEKKNGDGDDDVNGPPTRKIINHIRGKKSPQGEE